MKTTKLFTAKVILPEPIKGDSFPTVNVVASSLIDAAHVIETELAGALIDSIKEVFGILLV